MSDRKLNERSQGFLEKARKNQELLTVLENNHPNNFFETRITALFYIGLYYLHALASMKSINIGETHYDVEKNCNPDRMGTSMPIKRDAWYHYKELFKFSIASRYDPLTKQTREDYNYCLGELEKFKKYVHGQGLPVAN